jgi:uncharacterized protein (DUF2235 family)
MPYTGLAGMIQKVGLLFKDDFQQVPFAYKMYKRADHVGWEQSTEFKKAFSMDVNIKFVGFWCEAIELGREFFEHFSQSRAL